MKKIRFFISLIAILIGGGIVAVSLVSASSSKAYDDKATNRKFYLGEEILPDNVLYPILALADRARLEMALPTDRIYLQVTYSQQRLDYSKELIRRGERSLAQSTLTKSQKYLNLAAQEAINKQASAEVRKHVVASIDYHLAEVDLLIEKFSPEEKNVVDTLKNETKALRDVLARDSYK